MLEQIESTMAEGDWEGAKGQLRAFLQTNPTNSKGHAYLGICFEREKNLSEAAVHYQRAFALDPHFWDAGKKLFKCYDQLARYREALDTARNLLTLRPGDREMTSAVEQLSDILTSGRKRTDGIV